MSLNGQYLLYKFATELVKSHQFNILYLNEKSNEIWLEKKENRSSQVVRLINKEFDWKNHLKQDIAFLFKRITAAKRLFGRKIDIYNLYFATHPPVDSWETLKKPLHSQGKPQMRMKVYYLNEDDLFDETVRFQNDLIIAPIIYDLELPSEEKESKIEREKQNFINLLDTKKKELTDIFSYGKPFFTYILIAINLLLYLVVEFNGGSTSIETLIEYGAKYNPAIIVDGEWWRLISSMFLHIGMLHLLLNMIAVYYLGSAVEKMFGSMRFLFIYFIAGIGGSLASFAFSTSVSAGASGAIFGLFGALLYFGVIYKRIFFQTIGTSLLFIIAVNLVLGIAVDEIDMAAHMGGLILGFVAAAIVSLPKKKKIKSQVIAALLTLVILGSLTSYGVEANTNSQAYQLQKIQILINNDDYQEVIETANIALTLDDELSSTILFQRAYAYIQLEQFDKATNDLEKSVEYDNPLPESYYNLALLYEMDGDINRAVDAITQAYKMNSSDEDFINLYEKLTGESIQE